MKRIRAKRGIALIMALYLTAIVFVLGTFFIADQLNKSRSLFDYKDSKMALSSANLGLNYILNYLGDLSNHWSDSVLLKGPGGCISASTSGIPWGASGNTFTLTPGAQFLAKAPLPNTNANLFENDYTFSIDQRMLVSSAAENKMAQISGLLQIFYNNSLAAGDSCGVTSATNPYAINYIKVTVNVTLYQGNSTAQVATRQIQWTGARNVGLFAASYQCWTCWNMPGGKYPNNTESTVTASFVGNGFQADSMVLALGQNTAGQDRQASNSNNPNQSQYGIDYNGVMQMDMSANSNEPSIAQMNGLVMANNNININNPNNLPSPMNGKSQANTGVSAPLNVGAPFAPATGSSAPSTAPQTMLNDYASAETDGGCSSSVKTVFVASSMDVGTGINANGTLASVGHDFEYDASLSHQTLEPPVADVTLNNNGTFSVTTTGYYSGQIINQYNNVSASSVQNGILFFDGYKNVRVHGQLTGGSSLSVVTDQGEAFYNQNGVQLTQYTTPSGTTVNLNSTTSCTASNPNLSNTPPNGVTFNGNSLLAATRYQSNYGGTSSVGQDYWISTPPACVAKGTCTANANNSPTCANSDGCLYDGSYTNSSGVTLGYHADDTNGQPLTLDPTKTVCVSGCASLQTTDVQGFYSTVFAPPPTFNATGTYNGNTVLAPATVNLVDSNGTLIASKTVAPYPGASALTDLQKSPSSTPDDLFYTRQFEQSEGNLTIAGDTGFQGQNNNLGLLARNFVLVNDMVSGGSGDPNSKSSVGDYSMQVRASVASTNDSIQWEGNVVQDQNSKYAQDVFVNGDYVALNNKYANGTAYTMTYVDQNGVQRTAQADGWQGAPITKPGGGTVSPLDAQPNPSSGIFWQFRLFGSSQSPYQDVVNTVDSSGNYYGYGKERLDADKSNVYGPAPGFPAWSFSQYQAFGMPAFYVTFSYVDLGAIHSY